jgi:hypothetical protein
LILLQHNQATRCTGKYNQAVQNRNAQIAEQEAAQIEKQLEFDIARFDQQFEQLQGQTKTSNIKIWCRHIRNWFKNIKIQC